MHNSEQNLAPPTLPKKIVDLITKWLAFQIFFVFIQVTPSYLVLKLKNQKNILL